MPSTTTHDYHPPPFFSFFSEPRIKQAPSSEPDATSENAEPPPAKKEVEPRAEGLFGDPRPTPPTFCEEGALLEGLCDATAFEPLTSKDLARQR